MGSVIPLFVFMPAAKSLNPRTWLATGVCAVIGALGGGTAGGAGGGLFGTVAGIVIAQAIIYQMGWM